MHSRATGRLARVPARAVASALAVALGGCGSGGLTAHRARPAKTVSRTQTAGPAPTATTQAPVAPSGSPTATFHVRLTAAAPPPGSGRATIELFEQGAQSKVCWVFGKLAGVQDPYSAELQYVTPGTGAIFLVRLGTRYTVKGCAENIPDAALAVGDINQRASQFVLLVDTKPAATPVVRLSGAL